MRGRLFATVEAKNAHGMPLLEGGAAGGHGALPGGPRGRLHRGAGRCAPPAVTSLAALADVADVTGWLRAAHRHVCAREITSNKNYNPSPPPAGDTLDEHQVYIYDSAQFPCPRRPGAQMRSYS